jgi:hypothetical protein
MPDTILVTASNENYFPLLRGLLESIEKNGDGSVDIGVLDVGLAAATSKQLAARGVRVVAPPWDYKLASEPPGFALAQTARPHLPKHFPGYDIYMWLDADTWIQDWNAVGFYTECARSHGFAVTPESDRSYWQILPDGEVPVVRYQMFRSCFQEAPARTLAAFPLINSGVFAAHAAAPHWQQWSELLGEILGRQGWTFYAEQNSLNVVIRNGMNAGLKTAFLPASYNWMCNVGPVMHDGEAFTEPNPPYERLKILHLASGAGNGIHKVLTLDGHERHMSLRFGGEPGEEIRRA